MSGYAINKPSTELMQNYLRSTIMAPEKAFHALQKSDGGALLFSIGADGSFNVTAELSGERHGWRTVSLSNDQAAKDFPGSACEYFAVAQGADGSIHMAMVLREMKNGQPNDHLYLCDLGLSKSGQIDPPAWIPFAYDNPNTSRSRLEIAGIFLSQATDGEYVVADAIRDPSSAAGKITRYYVDRAKSDGHAWHLHDVPVDIEAQKYTSVLGRKDGASVDGIYTSGQIDGSPQIIYTPLFNETRPDRHPFTDYLKLTSDAGLVADAIAACRNPDNTSDLYAAAKGVLYRFASTNQKDNAIAAVAIRNPLFQRAKDLFAFPCATDRVMVWGRNADNDVFYTTCSRSQLDTPSAWSVPLPIMSGVQHVAPFVNRANSANTFFAHLADNQLKVARKRIDAKSPGSRAWSIRDVHLPLPDAEKKQKTPAQRFRSYTTHVTMTGPDNRPASGKRVTIQAAGAATSVYINHLYYAVGKDPIHVDADPNGSVTIIEPISRLDGTQFTVSVDGGSSKPLNPMQDASTVSARLKTLRTPQGLVDATIHYQNAKLKPSRPLVRTGKRSVGDHDVKAAAANVDHLWKAYDHISGDSRAATQEPLASPEPSERLKSFLKGKTPTKVDAGDLLLMLDSARAHRAAQARAGMLGAGESFWEIIVDFFEGVWQFIVIIGEAVFSFIIEVIEDVFAAFKYVFDKVVELIEDVIDFVLFLFELEDLQRTKDVVQHLTHLYLKDRVAYISTIRANFDAWIGSVINEIKDWAKPKNDALGSPRGTPATMGQLRSSAQSAPASASDSYLTYHFSNNLADAFGQGEPEAPPDGSSSLLAKLADLLQQELDALSKAAAELRALADHCDEKTPEEAVRQLVAILAKALLNTFKNVVDALLAVLEHVADWARKRFAEDALYIPIISDILAEFGVPEFTVSDLVCWLAAVPLTIGYKLATGAAPFPDDKLKDAPDFESAVKLLGGAAHARMNLAAGVKGKDSPRHSASASFHLISSVMAVVLAGVGTAEALSYKEGQPASSAVTGIIAFCSAFDNVSRFIALTVAPRVPFADSPRRDGAMAVREIVLCHKLAFGAMALFNAINPGDPNSNSSKVGKYLAMLGPITDPFLVITQLVFTGMHLDEIRHRQSYGNEENLGIVDEVSNLFNYFARGCRTALVVDSFVPFDPEVKAVIAAFAAAGRWSQGVFQFSEGAAELALDWPA